MELNILARVSDNRIVRTLKNILRAHLNQQFLRRRRDMRRSWRIWKMCSRSIAPAARSRMPPGMPG